MTINKTIDYARVKSRPKFTTIILLLSKIYKLLQTDTVITRRELYYQNVQIIKNQRFVDDAMCDICCLLDAHPWELGVLATSKGLVAGELIIITAESKEIDCKIDSGVLIPQNILGIRKFVSNAKFILIVEKDATFQKLLEEEVSTRVGSCIIITGKGYPDINTRLFVQRLWTCLHIPVYIVADADAHGIEIMCVYRFGSLGTAAQSPALALPQARWLGVHPFDINLLQLSTTPLTKTDQNKLEKLLERPYMCHDLKLQINLLLNMQVKAEIEAVIKLGATYMTDIYLPNKIYSNELL